MAWLTTFHTPGLRSLHTERSGSVFCSLVISIMMSMRLLDARLSYRSRSSSSEITSYNYSLNQRDCFYSLECGTLMIGEMAAGAGDTEAQPRSSLCSVRRHNNTIDQSGPLSLVGSVELLLSLVQSFTQLKYLHGVARQQSYAIKNQFVATRNIPIGWYFACSWLAIYGIRDRWLLCTESKVLL